MAVNEATDAKAILRANAEALIPVEISNEIIKEVPQASKLLPLMKRLPNMSASQKTIPITNALASAYFLNGETDSKKTSNAEWKKLTLTAEELAVIIPIPEATLADSAFNIWGEVKPQIVEALGIAIDQAILFGTNKPSSWPEAIVTQAAAKSHSVEIGTGVDVASDIIGEEGIMAKVEADGYRVTGFIADTIMEPKLRDLRDKNNNPIYVPALTDQVPDSLVGRRIAYDNTSTFDTEKALMVCGDFSKAVYSIRQDITYKVLTEAIIQNTDGSIAYNLAQQDMVALRCVMRLGVQIAIPATRRKGVNGYPFAVLTPEKASA
jgi:HK97 family phage major capsid protein